MAHRALVRLGVKPGFRILDFGARIGNYSLPAADLVTETGKAYALDKDRDALNELMIKSNHRPQLVRIDTDGGPYLPLPENSTDMILVFDVELNEPAPYLQEFHRVLTSNGILAVYLPIENYRNTARCDAFIATIRSTGFRLVRRVQQAMVHWDWVEEATVYLFTRETTLELPI